MDILMRCSHSKSCSGTTKVHGKFSLLHSHHPRGFWRRNSHVERGKEGALWDLGCTDLGAEAPEHLWDAKRCTGNLWLNLLWSQVRNEPKVENHTWLLLPIQECWRHNSTLSFGSKISVENTQGKTLVKLQGGKREGKPKKKEAETLSNDPALLLSVWGDFFGCTTPARAGNVAVFFF